MFELKPYLNLKNGTRQECQVSTKIVEEDGIKAVYIKGIAEGKLTAGFVSKLNADFGAGIDITIPDAETFMADVRYCEWWCRPEFGKDFTQMPDDTQGLVYKKTLQKSCSDRCRTTLLP